MTITEYCRQIKVIADKYALTRFVVDSKVNFDARSGEQCYVNGFINFIDGSALYFAEYLDLFYGNIDKLMYTYHYQGKENQLIFRYDNASHKPMPPKREHKHLPDKIEESPIPTLSDVLNEIFLANQWI